MTQMNLPMKQNHRHREPIGGCQTEEGSGRNGVEGWSEQVKAIIYRTG